MRLRRIVAHRLRACFLLCIGGLACSHEVPFHRGEGQAARVAHGEVDHRVILLGDAGAPDPEGEPSLCLVARWGGELPQRTTIVFLGDNVYETGCPTTPRWKERPSRRSSTRPSSTSTRAVATPRSG